MIAQVSEQQATLATLCRKYRVRRLQLFGSAATDGFDTVTSDLDFVAEFADTKQVDYADRYYDFAGALERLFNRPVDLLTPGAIRNPYFRAEIERTAKIVYYDRSEQMPG